MFVGLCVCFFNLYPCIRQGLKCTQDELAASAFLTVKLDDSMGGAPVQVGLYPLHLLPMSPTLTVRKHLSNRYDGVKFRFVRSLD